MKYKQTLSKVKRIAKGTVIKKSISSKGRLKIIIPEMYSGLKDQSLRLTAIMSQMTNTIPVIIIEIATGTSFL